MAKEIKQFVTPVGVASFVRIVEPWEEGVNAGKYTLDLFVRKEDWKGVGDKLYAAVEEELGSKGFQLSKLTHPPIHEVASLTDEQKAYIPEELHESIRIRMKQSGTIKGAPVTIHAVDQSGKELSPMDKAAIKSGSLVQASVSLYADKHSGNAYCRIAVAAVMHVGESGIEFPMAEAFKAKAVSVFNFEDVPAAVVAENKSSAGETTSRFFDAE